MADAKAIKKAVTQVTTEAAKAIVLAMVDVAVHEYANSTSAHDTVLEHRFSPTQTPFTSWQYANE